MGGALRFRDSQLRVHKSVCAQNVRISDKPKRRSMSGNTAVQWTTSNVKVGQPCPEPGCEGKIRREHY